MENMKNSIIKMLEISLIFKIKNGSKIQRYGLKTYKSKKKNKNPKLLEYL